MWLGLVYLCMWCSVTKWQDYLFNFWPFKTMKTFPLTKNMLKKFQNFAQYQINTQTNAQRLWQCCQSGEISANLVTLRRPVYLVPLNLILFKKTVQRCFVFYLSLSVLDTFRDNLHQLFVTDLCLIFWAHHLKHEILLSSR